MSRTYLDHASTSILRPEAHRAMADHLEAMASGQMGDPARIHTEGMTSRAVLEDARTRVAAWLGVRPRQIVFTSGATESIATAHNGALARGAPDGRETTVLTAVEHSSVVELAKRGASTTVAVDRGGRVTAGAVAAAVDDRTAVVHIQWANHELGVTQPVADTISAIGAAVSTVGTVGDERARPLVHVDAAQAGAAAPEAVATGADLVSISGHKLGAPVGVGVLVVRRNLRIPPLLVGGDQERARRGGMENIAAIAGLAAVADHLGIHGASETARLASMSERVVGWADRTEGVEVLGDRLHRSGHLVCLQLHGVEPQPVLLRLDQLGIAVHSGSSCSSEAFEPSPVLAAMGVDAQRSLRISLGWSNTDADIDTVTSALTTALGELRALAPPG